LDRPVDPIAEGFDVAIVPSAYALSSSVIARPLTDKAIVLCAAASYLEASGVPKTPNDLAHHPCIGFCPTMTGPADHWKLADAEGRPATVPVNIVLRSNNFALMRTAVRDGLGIGMLIEYTVEADLAEGRLVRVLPNWDVGAVHLNIVYPSREYLPRRVRALIDFVLEERDLLVQERQANHAIEQRKKSAIEAKAA
jgi:DNA-binding transcriptional LysR family regulator